MKIGAYFQSNNRENKGFIPILCDNITVNHTKIPLLLFLEMKNSSFADIGIDFSQN